MQSKKKRAMLSGTSGDWKKNTIKVVKKQGKDTGNWGPHTRQGVQKKKAK
jgi:hypothetical protein